MAARILRWNWGRDRSGVRGYGIGEGHRHVAGIIEDDMRMQLSSPQVRDAARIKDAVLRSKEVMGSRERGKFRG